jgi:hypothetical protein
LRGVNDAHYSLQIEIDSSGKVIPKTWRRGLDLKSYHLVYQSRVEISSLLWARIRHEIETELFAALDLKNLDESVECSAESVVPRDYGR